MRRILVPIFLLAGLVPGQSPAGVPIIGVLDFYGLRKVPEGKIRQALGAKEGDPLPPSKSATEEHIDTVSGVIQSHLEAVCCEAGKAILYVGIEERGAIHFELREPPEGEVALPEEIAEVYSRFLEAFEAAVRRGSLEEDLTHGHSLMADPSSRAIQEMFPPLAKNNLAILRDVLKNAADEGQRAMAAYVIAYAPNKREIVNDLQAALKDADPSVRGNAAKALIALSVLQRLDPDLGVRVQPTWFIEMLNSLYWSDRNQAVMALQVLTDKRDPAVLEQLRDRALPSLIEMARWKVLSHALPSYVLLGRIAGLSDQAIQDAWSRGDREYAITAATKKKK